MSTLTCEAPCGMQNTLTHVALNLISITAQYSLFHNYSNTITPKFDEVGSMTKSDEKILTFTKINYRNEALSLFENSREFTPDERAAYKEGIYKTFKKTGRNILDLL